MKAQENMCEWITIGFGFTSDWMKNWCEIGANFLSQSCSIANTKPITFRHSNENCSKIKYAHIIIIINNINYLLYHKGQIIKSLFVFRRWIKYTVCIMHSRGGRESSNSYAKLCWLISMEVVTANEMRAKELKLRINPLMPKSDV